jgi:hypothetical protein
MMSGISMSEARVATENGARYVQQLCKHWAHKFVVQYTARNGRVDFGEGRALAFAVSDGHLSLLAKAPDGDTLSKLEAVVADHLKRFASREGLEVNFAPVML